MATTVNETAWNLRSLKAHCFFALLAVLILIPVGCSAGEVHVRGYVTEVSSPTKFQVDSYNVTTGPKVKVVVEKDDPQDSAVDDPEKIRVGTDLEVFGEINERTGELKADFIRIFLEDTRRLKGTALLTKPPALEKTEKGWQGTLFADGQRVVVTEDTPVTVKFTGAERKQAWRDRAKAANEAAEAAIPVQSRPLTSADVLSMDNFVRYVGTRQKDGTILAQKVEFQSAEPDPSEAKMWRTLTPKVVKEPDYAGSIPGKLKVGRQKYKLFPSKEAQDYLSAFGQKLIPAHQKELPDTSPLKIPFKFYLVQDKEANAVAYANGVIIVYSGSFDTWENEAQIAYVVSHEISHCIEKHMWRMSQYHKNALRALEIGGLAASAFGVPGVLTAANLSGAGIQASYSRSLENQADRVALQEMLNAGYDIRQAPQACKAYESKHPTSGPGTWDSHDTFMTRRSFLLVEIHNNYADTDYSKLVTDSPDFKRIAGIVNGLTNTKKLKPGSQHY